MKLESFIARYYPVKNDFNRAVGIALTNRNKMLQNNDHYALAFKGCVLVVRGTKIVTDANHDEFLIDDLSEKLKYLSESSLKQIKQIINGEIKGRKDEQGI